MDSRTIGLVTKVTVINFPPAALSVVGGKFKPNQNMRKILFLAVMLTAIPPLCAQDKTAELRRTLTEHYVNDAEKQRAAAWLLDNMQYHGTVRSTLQDEYYNKLTRIAHSTAYPECEPLIYSLADSVYAVQDKDFKRVADADAVTAEYLITNIDQAFDRWRGGNFARHLSFEEFCEWLLPYQYRRLH